MKKTIVAALSLALLLCSCAGLPDRGSLRSVLETPYEAEAAVTDEDCAYVTRVDRDASGRLTVTFSEPAALCGVSYTHDTDGSRLVYKDLDIPIVAPAADRISSGVLVWMRLLSPSDEYTVRSSSENGKKIYVMSDGKTEYRFDAQTGYPIMIRNEKTTITFTGFRIKNDKPSEGSRPDIKGGA